MARKTQTQRLAEGRQLQRQLEAANMTTSWEYRFLTSVVDRMAMGRYPTKRQRDRFDQVVEAGVPKPKGDPKLLAQIDAAIAFWSGDLDRDWESGVLLDLRRNVFNGWELSDKQANLLDKLLQKSLDDKEGKNKFDPTPDQVDDLRTLVKLYRGYSPTWQLDRPALAKAVSRVERFLTEGGKIEEYHYNKLTKAMGTRLRDFRSPRFKKGDLSQYPLSIGGQSPALVVIMCLSDVYIDDRGRLANDWMLPGQGVKALFPGQLPKRLKK